jgi:hypothetical protein
MAGRNMAARGMRSEQIKCFYCSRWSSYSGRCAVHEKETTPDDKCAHFEREPGADDDIDEGEE